MSKLQTKSGISTFAVNVFVKGVELVSEDGTIKAVLNGEVIGAVKAAALPIPTGEKKSVEMATLVSAIDPASLIGKDPMSLSKEELVVLTTYLQELAGSKTDTTDVKEKTEKAAADKVGKKKKAAPVVEEEDDEDEEEDEAVALPKGIKTYEDLEKLGAKEIWKVAKPLGLTTITSRSKKGEILEALAAYFKLEPTSAVEDDEEEDELEEDSLPETMDEDEEEDDEDEDDEDEDDEEEDDDSDEDEDDSDDEEDDEDEDESDDEEDDEEDDEDEDDEEEDDEDDEDQEQELTPDDIDALETKEEIKAIMKKYQIKLPAKKLTARKVKQYIKEAIFGDDK